MSAVDAFCLGVIIGAIQVTLTAIFLLLLSKERK